MNSRLIRAPRCLSLLSLAALCLTTGSRAGAHAPHDVAYLAAVSPNYGQDQTVLLSVQLTDHALMARSCNAGRSWTHYGTPLCAAGVAALAFSPAFAADATVFAATKYAGVWRSTDGGVSWAPAGVGLSSVKTHAVSVSPAFAVDHTVLAATETGLFRSQDGGATWAAVLSGTSGKSPTTVTFAPDDAQKAFAAGTVLRCSSDGGATWHATWTFVHTVKRMVVSPHFSVDGTLAVCFGGQWQDGVLASKDGGASFAENPLGLTDRRVNDVAIADDGTFFAVSDEAACFRAAAALAPWQLFSAGFEELSDQAQRHYTSVAPSPSFSADGTLHVASFEGIFKSTDRGETWRQGDLYHQRIARQLVCSPTFAQDGLLYAGDYGGGPHLWNNQTGIWQGLAKGVESLWSGALSASPTFAADQTLFYGYGGLWISKNGGVDWTRLHSPVGMVRAVAMSPDFALDQHLYLSASEDGIYESYTAGAQWWKIGGGYPAAASTKCIVLSPQFPADPTLFAGTAGAGLWRSLDMGAAWQNVGMVQRSLTIRALAASPAFAADQMLLAGTVGAGLLRSDDRGATWVAVSGLPSGSTDIIEGIAFSPAFAVDRTVFVTSLYDGVLVSTDGGVSWQKSSAGLPGVALRGITVSPDFPNDRVAFASTHEWIYRSTDGGASWLRLPGYLRVDEKHPAVLHSGTWTMPSQGASNGGSVKVSNQAGASEEYDFHGDSLTWFALKDTECGLADVLVDGVLAATVDLYSMAAVPQQPVFQQTFPSVGWHTIRIEVTGQKSPAASGCRVKSDGFDFTF
ncbi:MAG: hypothetical protein HY812_06605 [Planctomycetes bacterium]|nr:hypothetical protein [Planctomycetota bacterium]